MNPLRETSEAARPPRVVFIGLASCFGCQINITNIEAHLLEVLGQIDLGYWQLTSSIPMPEAFDVAVIEGAVTTAEAADTVREARQKAKTVITIGACANTAGIPGMASVEFPAQLEAVYGSTVPAACGTMQAPVPVKDVVAVDFEVPCCPIDPYEFVRVLDSALYGSNHVEATSVLCGECTRNERGCFYKNGKQCLGLVTKAGCGARCPALGRPCNGCAGLSPDANVASARGFVERRGFDVRRFDDALGLFNTVSLTAEGEE